MKRVSLLVAPVLLVASAVVCRPARACSRDAGLDQNCVAASVTPAEGTSMPSNAPGVLYLPAFEYGAAPTTDGFALLDSQGATVPLTIASDATDAGRFLIAPTGGWIAGSYRVRFPATCDGSGEKAEHRFTVTAAQPLPSTIGTVSLVGSRELLEVPDSGLCSRTADAAVVRLQLAPANDLTAFGELVRYSLTVDGKPWSSGAYGGDLRDASAESSDQPDLIYAACDGSTRLQVGKHHGVLEAHVAGAQQDPTPLGFDFELRCDNASVSGCSYAGPARSAAGAAFWLAAFSSLLLLAVRRRRSWPRKS